MVRTTVGPGPEGAGKCLLTQEEIMKRILAVVAVVLFVAVYGFDLNLPTAAGTLQIRSGFKTIES